MPKITGLTHAEVADRLRTGRANGNVSPPTKSVAQIIRSNTLTFFNLINVVLAAAIFAVGSYHNALFMGVVIANTAIGIFQELRAKRTIDRLSLISAPKAHVIREGEREEIPVSGVVLDDVLTLGAGMQICADSRVILGECEVNESLVTGESDPVEKKPGDELLSGSFVICGEAAAKVEKVGADSFAAKITKGAKYLKRSASQMLTSVNKIIKVIAICVVPVMLIRFYQSIFLLGEDTTNAVTSTVASVIGMIPEGLVLLMSMVLAVSAMRLAKHQTLVQDMYCIETLARVDVLCLDKTGTITEGVMQVEEVLPLVEESPPATIDVALCALMKALPDTNPTAAAVAAKYGRISEWQPETVCPFSSAKKWSGATFYGKGSYVMGAAEFILPIIPEKIQQEITARSQNGQRVVLLAGTPEPIRDKQLPGGLRPLALIAISDKIRPEAPDTLKYFTAEGVDVKVISGDNPVTVASVARRAGLVGADSWVDMTTISDKELAAAARRYTVFGRVTPAQKLALVKALKAAGHTVGMTGDGVNDVLALKEADCSIAMQSGSDAARNVSSLVLLDSNFASMPKVVAEGRRSINNIERSATLFLTKTVYAFLLSITYLFIKEPYPLFPIQLTLISGLFIGFPSFVLALEPNLSLVKGRFIENVMKRAAPFGICTAVNILLLAVLGSLTNFETEEMRAAATVVLGFTSLLVLARIAQPFGKRGDRGVKWLRVALLAAMAAAFAGAVGFMDTLFAITRFTPEMFVSVLILCGLGFLGVSYLPKAAEAFIKRYKRWKASKVDRLKIKDKR